MTTPHKYLELRQQRDFGEVLNTTFEFITANFGNFFKVIFTIVGPFFILATTILGLFGYRLFNKFMGLQQRITYKYQNRSDGLMNYQDAILIFVSIFIIMAGFLVLYLAIYGYIKSYQEKKTGDISVAEVLVFVKKNTLRFIGSALVLLLLFSVIGLLIFLIVLADTGGIGVLLIFFVAIAIFAIYIYQSLFFAILAFEPVNPFEAIMRGFRLISGNWWFTLGVAFVLGFLNTIINSVVQYGATAIMGVIGYNSYDSAPSWLVRIGFVSFGVLVGIMYIFISSISLIKDAVLYFSFVERKDSIGLMEKIQLLGGEQLENDAGIKIERNKQEYTNEGNEEDF